MVLSVKIFLTTKLIFYFKCPTQYTFPPPPPLTSVYSNLKIQVCNCGLTSSAMPWPKKGANHSSYSRLLRWCNQKVCCLMGVIHLVPWVIERVTLHFTRRVCYNWSGDTHTYNYQIRCLWSLDDIVFMTTKVKKFWLIIIKKVIISPSNHILSFFMQDSANM